MKTHLLAFILFAAPAYVFAQVPTPSAGPAAPQLTPVPRPGQSFPMPGPQPASPPPKPVEEVRYEWLEIATASIVDIECEITDGWIAFSVDDGRYKGMRFTNGWAGENQAARIASYAAILAELRHTDHIKLQVVLSRDGKWKPEFISFKLCYAKAK